jgi:hypothetical protein
MLPLAPGRFSITTGWPMLCDSASPIERAMVSIEPPAETDTTMWIGLDGYGVWALARTPASKAAGTTRDGSASSVRRFMNGDPCSS